MPRPATHLQPRSHFRDRLAQLRASHPRPVTCVLTGPRGVGKTQLAAAYFRDCETAGWPVLVWLSAASETSIVAGWAEVAEVAGARKPEVAPRMAARAALQWLRTAPCPALIVLDDLHDIKALDGWLPTVGDVQIVVTAVRHSIGDLGQQVRLDAFTESEAATYLQQRTGLNDPDGATKLAQELGHLPMAIAQAAAIVGPDKPFTTYQLYMARLAALPVDIHLKEMLGDPYPHRAAQAIRLSIEDLQHADSVDLARTLLEFLAVLSAGGASLLVLTQTAQSCSTTRGRFYRRRSAVYGNIDTALWLLADRSMVVRHDDTLSTHRLIRRVVLDDLVSDGRLDTIISDVTRSLTKIVMVQGEDKARRLDDQHILAQIDALWDVVMLAHPNLRRLRTPNPPTHLGPHDKPRERDAINLTTVAALVELSLRAGDRLDWRLDLQRAINLRRTVLVASSQVLGSSHPHTTACRMNLAHAYGIAGQFTEAIDMLSNVIADRARSLGPDHPETPAAQQGLARWQREAAGDPPITAANLD